MKSFVQAAASIKAARLLIWQLFKRDFFAAYRKSILGLFWIVIAPLAGVVSWVLLQHAGLLKPGDMDVPYPVYVLLGSSMWGLFMGLLTQSSQTLQAGLSFVLQVNFPHEALLFKQIAQQLATFLITFVLNLIVLACFGIFPHYMTLLLPLVALPLFLLAAGLGIIISMYAVMAQDVSRAVQLVLGFGLYLMPVIYSEQDGLLGQIVQWNPLTYLVCSCRDIVLYGRLYGSWEYALSALFALVIFVFGWRLFFVAEKRLVERMY